MSSAVCSHCGCSDIDTDPARGDAVCTGCGSVLEDQIIVSEVQFQENAMGGCSMLGQYVGAEGNKSHSMGSGFHHGLGRESRDITLQNGRRRITQLGEQLRLSQHCIETAYNFFKMAVSRRLTHGRKTSHVIAACLYIVCRTEGTSHMLLDFSDILQVNVYHLGRTYLHLSKALCINIPALDPCLFIDRFAHKLEFGDKTHEVSMTALRLVSRMKRDWMAQGRRPSGVCGAGLLVAARMHDFSRTINDVIKVVKIGSGTVRKRLLEFEQTPSSQLTIDEFNKIDLEEEMDPPCFTEGKRKARLQQLEEQGKLPEITEEIKRLQNEIDQALDEAVEKKSRRYASKKSCDSESVCSTTPSIADLDEELEEQGKAKEFLDKETLKYALDEDSQSDSIVDAIMKVQNMEQHNTQVSQDSLAMPPPLSHCRPTAASLGLKDSIEDCMKVPETQAEEEQSGELDLEGIEDEELDKYILTADEVKVKTKIWMHLNADFLKEMQEKAEKKAQLERAQAEKPDQKKRKKARRKANNKEALNAREAIEKMLQEKKISSKINYDVLKNLNQVEKKAEILPTAASLLGDGVIIEPVNLPKPPAARLSFMQASKPLHTPLQSRFKRPSPSKVKIEPKEEVISPPRKKPKTEADIVVESGPVQYAEAEEEEEEDEEEEEQHFSAATLMGHTAGDEDELEMYDDDVD